jgi:hypothetical protein
MMNVCSKFDPVVLKKGKAIDNFHMEKNTKNLHSVVCCRIMQAMLDRLVPVFIDHLFMDYQRWVEEGAASLDSDCMSSLESISIPPNANGQKRLPVEVATST